MAVAISRKHLNRALGAAVVLLVLIQFIPVNRDNPPATSALALDGEVGGIIKRSCFDCHSNNTVWPWYSYVAPASWLVARHVRKGRSELNFSEWGDYSARRMDHKLEEVGEEVGEGKMPLRTYLPLHPSAKLTVEQKEALLAWADSMRAVVGYVPEPQE